MFWTKVELQALSMNEAAAQQLASIFPNGSKVNRNFCEAAWDLIDWPLARVRLTPAQWDTFEQKVAPANIRYLAAIQDKTGHEFVSAEKTAGWDYHHSLARIFAEVVGDQDEHVSMG